MCTPTHFQPTLSKLQAPESRRTREPLGTPVTVSSPGTGIKPIRERPSSFLRTLSPFSEMEVCGCARRGANRSHVFIWSTCRSLISAVHAHPTVKINHCATFLVPDAH